MAIYRTVSMTFWTDRKVTDEFTSEDKYFYLYLFTNPHTNLCGCYEISLKQIANEMGYSKDAAENLLKRFEEVHNVLRFSKETKEVLLLNWSKYNWTSSEKFRKPLFKEIQLIKDVSFRNFLQKLYDGEKIVYGIDTTCIDTSVSVSDTVINNINNNINNKKEQKEEVEKNFAIIYNSYPKKVGKSKGYEHYLQWLKGRVISGRKIKLTNKQIWNAISRYKKQCEDNDTELQYYKNFDIFMNKAILDYVEED